MLSKTASFATVEWTPLLLSGLGLLVSFQLRVAIAFTRLIGSFTILGIVLAGILLFTGFGDGGELTYGSTTVTDPHPWQLLLMLITIAATMVPPWWMLQRALARHIRVHGSTRVERI